MPILYVVRHAEAAAGWTEDRDPGLSLRGREQAREMAEALQPLGSRPIVSSPLRRARETAAELEARWGMAADIEPTVGELPTPDGVGLAERGGWLRGLLDERWSNVDGDTLTWRRRLLETVETFRSDTLVVSHYVAINALVGAATDDDRVVCFRPGHCTVTVLEHDDAGLRLLEAGASAHSLDFA